MLFESDTAARPALLINDSVVMEVISEDEGDLVSIL